MPSPIAHAVSGYAISRLASGARLIDSEFASQWKRRSLLLYAVGVAIAADLDFVPQILTGDRYHHGPTHSLAFAMGAALLSWIGFSRVLTQGRSRQIGLLTLALYGSHLALDLVTKGGEGIQLLWPFTQNYYQSPWLLFPSTGWSKGWFHPQHFIFLAFELGYSALIVAGLSFLNMGKRATDKRKPLPETE